MVKELFKKQKAAAAYTADTAETPGEYNQIHISSLSGMLNYGKASFIDAYKLYFIKINLRKSLTIQNIKTYSAIDSRDLNLRSLLRGMES